MQDKTRDLLQFLSVARARIQSLKKHKPLNRRFALLGGIVELLATLWLVQNLAAILTVMIFPGVTLAITAGWLSEVLFNAGVWLLGAPGLIATHFLATTGVLFTFRFMTFNGVTQFKDHKQEGWYLVTPILLHELLPWLSSVYSYCRLRRYPERLYLSDVHRYPDFSFQEYKKILAIIPSLEKKWLPKYESEVKCYSCKQFEDNDQFSHINILIKMGAQPEDFPKFSMLQTHAQLAMLLENIAKDTQDPGTIRDTFRANSQMLLASKMDAAFLNKAEKVFTSAWDTTRKVQEQRDMGVVEKAARFLGLR